MHLIYIFLITFTVFLTIDLVWLGVIARPLYKRYIGHHLRAQTRWVAAIIFYALYTVGIIIFAIMPASTALGALILGGMFGFFCYATYELTNYAVIKKWPLPIVFIDIIWGVILTGSVAGLSAYIIDILAITPGI